MSEYISSDNDESSYYDNRDRHGWSIPSTRSRSYSSHAPAHAITSRNPSYGHSSAPIIVSDSEDDIKKEDSLADAVPLSESSGEYLIVSHIPRSNNILFARIPFACTITSPGIYSEGKT